MVKVHFCAYRIQIWLPPPLYSSIFIWNIKCVEIKSLCWSHFAYQCSMAAHVGMLGMLGLFKMKTWRVRLRTCSMCKVPWDDFVVIWCYTNKDWLIDWLSENEKYTHTNRYCFSFKLQLEKMIKMIKNLYFVTCWCCSSRLRRG